MSTTKDLTREPPRSPRQRIKGYALMARMIDKGRATISGTGGGYHFNCPLDKMLFDFKGINSDEVHRLLERGATDEQIADWIDTHGTPKTPEEVSTWSARVETYKPAEDPEKKEWFEGECKPLGLDPATTTLFDYLETDDRVSYSK